MKYTKAVNIDCFLHEIGGGYGIEKKCLKDNNGEYILKRSETKEEIINNAKEANILLVESVTKKIDKEIINELDNCWMIGKYTIGVDNIDIDAASKKGIVVCNLPDYCIEEVSDLTVTLILTLVRQIIQMHDTIKRGGWRDKKNINDIHRVNQLQIGLVAFGKIPQLVAKKMVGFDCKIVTYDPFISNDILEEYGVDGVTLDELLTTSDIVSVHTPLNSKTKHMISTPEFNKMKNEAYIVNTSRGSVLDEKALIMALQEKLIAGAALDVTEVEPLPADSPLRYMDNVVITPHAGSSSIESDIDVHYKMAKAMEDIILGKWPRFALNRDIKPRISLK